MNGMRRRVLDVRICWLVLLTFGCLALFPVEVHASLVESRLADGTSISERVQMIEKIRQALEREVVAQRLADFGLSREEVAAKLPSFSDEQLHQLAGLSDSLGEGGVLGLVISVLLIVLLVVVILKVMDKEIVIK